MLTSAIAATGSEDDTVAPSRARRGFGQTDSDRRSAPDDDPLEDRGPAEIYIAAISYMGLASVVAVNLSGNTTESETLERNVPNPVREATSIRFVAPRDGPVALTVHDLPALSRRVLM